MSKQQAILTGLIYRLKRGHGSAYATNPRRYCCVVPAVDFNPETWLGDCWITDKDGNFDPGLSCSPVPILRDSIGALIGRIEP